MDLPGAYNTVPRPTLWEALSRLGIGGKTIGTRQLYADTSVRIEGPGPEPSGLPGGLRGVCPPKRVLSRRVRSAPPSLALMLMGYFSILTPIARGVVFGNGVRITILGYAENFVLVSNTP